MLISDKVQQPSRSQILTTTRFCQIFKKLHFSVHFMGDNSEIHRSGAVVTSVECVMHWK